MSAPSGRPPRPPAPAGPPAGPATSGTPPAPAEPADLLTAAGREWVVLASGVLAGVCVFFAPLVVLALGLLAAYLASVASDGHAPVFGLGRPLEAADFRSVFAPAINEAPLLVSAGLVGGMLAQFRRWLARRTDPSLLVAGIRPIFPEFALLYTLLVGLALGVAATHGGWPHVTRLLGAAPIFLLFMLIATWLAHAIWHYSFCNIIDLLARDRDRDAASALRGRARWLGSHRPSRWV